MWKSLAVQKLLSFYEKWSKIEINIAGNDDYSMFHEKLVPWDAIFLQNTAGNV